MEIFKEFSFEAAHALSAAPPGHKCRRLHGHSYRVAIHVRGPVDPQTGWVMDFAELSKAFDPIRQQLDHADLNAIEGLSCPTSEVLARWIWSRLKPALPGLCKIVVRETATSGCIYMGEDE